ncbi:MAG: hypothetical protein ACLTJG_08520 [[Clostridium] innocuum]
MTKTTDLISDYDLKLTGLCNVPCTLAGSIAATSPAPLSSTNRILVTQ